MCVFKPLKWRCGQSISIQFWLLHCTLVASSSLTGVGPLRSLPLLLKYPIKMASESPMNGTKASPKNTTIDNLTDTLSKVQMDDENGDPLNNKSPNHPPRKLVIYPRLHLLTLYKSPLVKLPEDMPPLKDWFGCVLHHISRILPQADVFLQG